MNKARELYNKLEELTSEYVAEKKKLEKMQSRLDKEINKFYHNLESRGNFNAAEGYYIAKDLQELLKKRRVVKQELYTLRMVNNNLQFNKIESILPHARKCLNTIQKDQKRVTLVIGILILVMLRKN